MRVEQLGSRLGLFWSSRSLWRADRALLGPVERSTYAC